MDALLQAVAEIVLDAFGITLLDRIPQRLTPILTILFLVTALVIIAALWIFVIL